MQHVGAQVKAGSGGAAVKRDVVDASVFIDQVPGEEDFSEAGLGRPVPVDADRPHIPVRRWDRVDSIGKIRIDEIPRGDILVFPEVVDEEAHHEGFHLQVVAEGQGVEVAVVPAVPAGGQRFLGPHPGEVPAVGVELHAHGGLRPEERVHGVGLQTDAEAGLAVHRRELEVGVGPAGLDVHAVAGPAAALGLAGARS